MYNGGKQISSDNRTESRQHDTPGRQQTYLQYGEQIGHHRGLRMRHVGKRVTRELGRASRFLGSTSRKKGDRHNQHPGVYRTTSPMDEPTPVRTGRNTKNASHQGTGRERKADRPGRTEAVVATHSTAGQGATSARKRGEPRPKGPTITLTGAREGNAGHDVCAKERQEGL